MTGQFKTGFWIVLGALAALLVVGLVLGMFTKG